MANFLVLIAGMILATTPAGSLSSSTMTDFRPVPVLVEEDSTATVDLSAGVEGGNFLLVLGSVSDNQKTSKFELLVEEISKAQPIQTATAQPGPLWHKKIQTQRRVMAARRRLANDDGPEHSVTPFAQRRSFYLFVGENDFYDAENYVEVTARLVAVGKHSLVYVDEEDDPEEFDPAVVEEVLDGFDNHVHPVVRSLFGRHLDVDRNGKFTILFSHWLGNLSGGKVSLGGFVRGGDFYRDVVPPFSNRCDMLYLNSNLRAGEHLRTLLAHEYTHAITFSEHVFGDYLPGAGGIDEESWLNEALSHLAENVVGGGWSNLDYRISTFLSAPDRYRLVVPDYFRSGLWRCHGSRGSTYLFLRWCVDRYGDDLLRELTQSGLRGVENLEAATQTPFHELFRDWTVALCLDGIQPAEGAKSLRSLDLCGRLGKYLLTGPRFRSLQLGSSVLELQPTSFFPLRVHVPSGKVLRVRVKSEPKAGLQVTLIRLPDDLPSVEPE